LGQCLLCSSYFNKKRESDDGENDDEDDDKNKKNKTKEKDKCSYKLKKGNDKKAFLFSELRPMNPNNLK